MPAQAAALAREGGLARERAALARERRP